MVANLFSRALNRGIQTCIGLKQRFRLKKEYGELNSCIIFLIPGYELKSGGILSIFSFYRETKRLFSGKKAVFMASYPGHPKIEKYNWFNNDVYVYSFDDLIEVIKDYSDIHMHLPEYYVEQFYDSLTNKVREKIKKAKTHINIMNQNIECMPEPKVIQRLYSIADSVTMTNAHERYTTNEYRELYGVPVHLLASWYDQEPIKLIPYEKKLDKMIVSPDPHPAKEHILKYIKENIPSIELIIIKNVKYEDFKQLEKESKWSMSFGEGLDGYFAGPVLRGGVGFAVYNELFFTPAYKDLPTVFTSFDHFANDIVNFIKNNDNKIAYEKVNSVLFDIIDKQFNHRDYVNNIELYYSQRYTFS